MEVMLAFSLIRGGEFEKIQKKIRKEIVLRWDSNRKQANITLMINQLTKTRATLDAHDIAIGSFWLSLSKLVPTKQISELPFIDSSTRNPTQTLSIEPKTPGLDTESLQDILIEVSSNFSSPHQPQSPFRQSKLNPHELRWNSVSSGSRTNSISPPSSTTTDAYSYAKEIASFVPFNTTRLQPVVRHQYPLSRRLGRQRNYFASGVSSGCSHVFFLEQALAEVFEIPLGSQTPTPNKPLLRLERPNKDLFRSASIGESFFAVIAGSTCSLYALGSSQEICSPIRLADWDPECVNIGTFDSLPAVVIGWRKGMAGTNKTRGKLTVHMIPQQHVKAQLKAFISIPLHEADYPKYVSLTQLQDYIAITCITQRLNIVSAWHLTLQPPNFELLCSTPRLFTAVNMPFHC